MLDMISNFLTTVDDFVWGIPLIVLILATGLFLTARLRFLQITKLPHAIKHLIANEKSGEDGEVSSFAALCTALSATIGTGNIVGVATDEEYRRQGVMRELLVKTFQELRSRGELFTYLMPADENYYLPFDFRFGMAQVEQELE